MANATDIQHTKSSTDLSAPKPWLDANMHALASGECDMALRASSLHSATNMAK
jgi:hypothetical protein